MPAMRHAAIIILVLLSASEVSRAQRDPQVGPNGGWAGVSAYKGTVEKTKTLCLIVTALKSPAKEMSGNHYLRYAVYILPDNGSDYSHTKKLSRIAVDEKTVWKSSTEPSAYVGGANAITAGKHTFSINVSEQAQVDIQLVMQSSNTGEILAKVDSCKQ
jgi:hypothetical protein